MIEVLETRSRRGGRGADPARRDRRTGRHLLAAAPARPRRVYAVQRRTVRADIADAALADAVDAVRRLDAWYLAEVGPLYGELRDGGAGRGERARPTAPGRGRRDARRLRRAGGRGRPRRRCCCAACSSSRFRPPAELPVVAWSAGAMAMTDTRRALQRHGPQGTRGRRGLGPGARPGRPASSPCPTPAAGCSMDDRVRLQVLVRRFADAELPAARRRRRVDLGPDGDAPGRRAGIGADGTVGTVGGPHDVSPRRRPRPAGTPASSPSTGCWIGALGRRRPDRPLPRCATPPRSSRAGSRPSSGAGRPTRSWCGIGWSACPTRCRLRRIADTDLWYVTTELPEGSRVEYQFEVVRGDSPRGVRQRPAQPPGRPRAVRLAVGAAASGYVVPVLVPARPRGPTGCDRVDLPAQQGACAARVVPALPARPGSARWCATRC